MFMRASGRTIMMLAFVLITSVSSWAYDFKVDGIAYSIYNN